MAAATGTFSGTQIGDYISSVSFSTAMPDTEIQIPRAQGIRQRDMGGGAMVISVRAYVVKTTTALLQQYFEALPRAFGTGLASLVIDSVTYTNCKFLALTPDNRWQDRVDYFTCTFKKSAATQ